MLKLFITLDVSLWFYYTKINHDGIYRPESFSTDVKGMKIKKNQSFNLLKDKFHHGFKRLEPISPSTLYKK
jgi:hypothetical protein